MGCFTLGAKRTGQPEVVAENHGEIVVGSAALGGIVIGFAAREGMAIAAAKRGSMEIGAYMVCTVKKREKVYLKDSLGRSLIDILGRYLLGKDQ